MQFKDIPIIVTTCNEMAFLMRGFAYCFNKFWSKDKRVNVLYYDVIPTDLPENFVCHSLGHQADYGKFWTNALIEFISNLSDKYFFLFLEDDYFIGPVDFDKFKAFEKYMDGSVKKFDVAHCVLALKYTNIGDGLSELNQDSDYRTFVGMSALDREYFLQKIEKNWTAWDVEIIGGAQAKNDGAKIIGYEKRPEVPCKIQSLYRTNMGGIQAKCVGMIPEPLRTDILNRRFLERP
jgi:hypothetical protein